LLAGAFLSVALPAHAVFIGNIQGGTDFPQGAVSFADAVVTYSPNGPPSAPHQGAINALDVPDYVGVNSCPSQAACSFVSLGQGGSIVLRFVDNALTGSGNADPDLWIFEVGPDIENTFIDVSTDGITWNSVGFVGGSTAGVDIDAFGFGVGSTFNYVRLTDDPNEGGGGVGGTVGADIDAVGAISTVRVPVPEPATLALLALGLAAVGGFRRRA
jgi:hypothetical protein